MNFYNEFDPKAAAWLRELIKEGLIPNGHVDERSIADVSPNDLDGFTQCHFFAGIGGWSEALRLAGWPSDKPVWTGSCPCQPFSTAGKQLGTSDSRHLWPEFARLIKSRKPATVFGEQVASKAGRGWLAGVFADLEAMGYSRAAADLCAAGVGAPHIRQRLWWVADARSEGVCGSTGGGNHSETKARDREHEHDSSSGGSLCGLADSADERYRSVGNGENRSGESERDCGLGDSDSSKEARLGPECVSVEPKQETGRSGDANAWKNSELIFCRDGKSRRSQPGLCPLAHGVPGRLGLLRGYGNAIVPQVAAEFIQAFVEARSLISH